MSSFHAAVATIAHGIVMCAGFAPGLVARAASPGVSAGPTAADPALSANLSAAAAGAMTLAADPAAPGWRPSGSAAPKLTSSLAAALSAAGPGDLVPVVVLLQGVPADEVRFTGQGLGVEGRREAIGRLLRTTADSAQVNLRRLLEGARFAAEACRASEAAPSPPARRAATSTDWGVSPMGAPDVWTTYGTRGEGIVIAVIDMGSCYTHPDIAKRIWINPGEDINHNGVVMDSADMNGIDDDGNGYLDDVIGWDFGAGVNNPQDSDGHGSHTAGTLVGDGTSGTSTGMAPGAKLMVIRLSIDTSWTDGVNSWLALEYAVANGARVASLSYGWLHEDPPDSPDRAG